MVNEKLCTVCGYEMEEGPRDWNICPSCGTEFGLHDVNSTIDDLRTVWFASGPRWHSSVVPQPTNWNPFQQIALVMRDSFVAQRHVYTIAADSSSSPNRDAFPEWAFGLPHFDKSPSWELLSVPVH